MPQALYCLVLAVVYVRQTVFMYSSQEHWRAFHARRRLWAHREHGHELAQMYPAKATPTSEGSGKTAGSWP